MTLLQILDKKPIIFIGGKGGVGKTTCAAALAVRFARAGRKTLIVSTDPAHSLGDAFAEKLSGKIKTLQPNLDALELSPDDIIHQHFKNIERTLEGYTMPEMMPKMREFLRLSHHAPGAEEAAMLEAICRHLLDAKSAGYQHIIFDTAPTGHTLRLLNLPEMMQAWTDGLLAQQKRQNQLRAAANTLGANPLHQPEENRWTAAVNTLKKRRELFKATREMLHDSTQTAIVLVLIPENLPLAETKRAAEQLAAAKLPCAGLVVNQVISASQNESFWQQRAARQQAILMEIAQHFPQLPRLELSLRAEDICGTEALGEIFGE